MTDYVEDKELSRFVAMILDMGGKILRTTELDSGNWEVEYEL